MPGLRTPIKQGRKPHSSRSPSASLIPLADYSESRDQGNDTSRDVHVDIKQRPPIQLVDNLPPLHTIQDQEAWDAASRKVMESIRILEKSAPPVPIEDATARKRKDAQPDDSVASDAYYTGSDCSGAPGTTALQAVVRRQSPGKQQWHRTCHSPHE